MQSSANKSSKHYNWWDILWRAFSFGYLTNIIEESLVLILEYIESFNSDIVTLFCSVAFIAIAPGIYILLCYRSFKNKKEENATWCFFIRCFGTLIYCFFGNNLANFVALQFGWIWIWWLFHRSRKKKREQEKQDIENRKTFLKNVIAIAEAKNNEIDYYVESIDDDKQDETTPEQFYCPVCQSNIEYGDNFCKNCARKLTWKQKIELS